jgi:hypothetical protein
MRDTVTIGKFRAHYRLPPSRFTAKPRLDRLLPEVAGEALEIALERAGVRSSEIVCLRRVFVPVRLRLSQPDSVLIAEWSVLLADAIAEAGSAAGSESSAAADSIVRYGSLALAIVAMGTLVAEGRFQYVWAWRQMGFWRGRGEFADANGAALEFGAALASQPRTAVAVLSVLAARGLLRRLVKPMEESWAAIATAVLGVTGGHPDFAREFENYLEALAAGKAHVFSARAEQAIQAAARSPILQECTGVRMPRPATLSLSLMALLEREPSLVRAESDQLMAAVAAVEERIFDAWREIPALPASGSTSSDEALSSPSSRSVEPRVQESTPWQSPRRQAGPRQPGPIQGSRGGAGHETELGPGSDKTNLDESPLRAEAWTDFGGLLFLLNIVDALNIPARALAENDLSARGYRWFQHRLALALQPLSEDDPAALAFCGLGPAEEPPSQDQPPASSAEEAVIHAFAKEIRNALSSALPEPVRAAERLMQFVCRRRALITADPGWIEARFSLADVSTEIRRTGLDLNPDYVPWLGVVVRFVYE